MSGHLGTVAVLLVAVPLLSAALVAAVSHWLPRVVADVVAIAVALASFGLAALLCHEVGGAHEVAWLGSWLPQDGESVGVALVADRGGATIATIAAGLTVAALVYSWRYLEEVHATYQVLMLVFLAAMSGFAFAGDLFTMFVWFELMGVAAYALTGMRVEEPRSVHGALGFGIVNSLGASMALLGVGLLYARTGELNLAAVGTALRGQPSDALVAAAAVLLVSGFLVKAAAVPFHFWTADAEAVAPSPVCAVLSGAMVTVGVYGVARVWWVVFDGVLPQTQVRATLVTVGSVTAVVGAVVCVAQRHIKRLLAYSTVSHVGVMVIAVGLLGEDGILAAGLYAVGQAGVKGALFLAAGGLLNRFETVDEHLLVGRASDMPRARLVFLLGGLGLVGFPGVGTWMGKSALEHTAMTAGRVWVIPIALTCSVLTAGAVWRVAVRVFTGLAPRPDDAAEEGAGTEHEEPETEKRMNRVPWSMIAPAFLLLAATVPFAIWPALQEGAATAAAAFVDVPAYVDTVLRPDVPAAAATGSMSAVWTVPSVLLGLVGALVAAGVAAIGVWGVALPSRVRRTARAVRWPIDLLHDVHSGHVGDYVAWLLVGVAAIGVGFTLR